MISHGVRCAAALTALCASLAAAAGGTPLTTVRVATGLDHPLYVTAPSGDFERAFILEQDGRIRILDITSNPPVLLPVAFLDIDDLISSTGERGLLGLAFHPEYAQNGWFFVNYTDNAGDTVVARYQVMGDPSTSNTADPDSAALIMMFDQPAANHNGGWIAFGPDGNLYIATGDGGSSSTTAQDTTDQPLGKMLRIDVDGGDDYPADPLRNYALPADNPFVGVAGDDEIWAYGLRNPWRNAFDALTGDLYIGDVGQTAVEEVNFQPASSAGGENYGWRCMEGNTCTSLSGCICNDPSLTLPIHTYTHAVGCAITGGEVYRGCAIPDLAGEYFFADLCANRIWSFRVEEGAAVDVVERTAELDPPGSQNINSVSSFGRDAYGELYVCDLNGGEVFKIIPATAEPTQDCDENGREDGCDLADGTLTDANHDGFPDECAAVPAASGWGMLALAILLSAAAAVILRSGQKFRTGAAVGSPLRISQPHCFSRVT